MKCKVFTIRLVEEHFAKDEAVFNDFLQCAKVSQIASSFSSLKDPSWSILLFYEDELPESRRIEEISENEGISLTPIEEVLYKNLKKWRNDRAETERIPPFTIAHNQWLKQMIKLNVKTKRDLLQIKGFGEKRMEKYGEEILTVLDSNR